MRGLTNTLYKIRDHHLFAVEPDGRRRVHVLVEFEPVEYCCLPREVQSEHGAVIRGQGRDVLSQVGESLLCHCGSHRVYWITLQSFLEASEILPRPTTAGTLL